jgi:hypothetical protein
VASTYLNDKIGQKKFHYSWYHKQKAWKNHEEWLAFWLNFFFGRK